jgi:alpha-tubulin suppressor-like RCC1 family protein
MRWLSLLLALAACDPTLEPDPPALISGNTRAFSIGYGHILVATEGDKVTPGELLSLGTEVPAPSTDANGDGTRDALVLPAIADVAAGLRHACVLSTTGTVHCWGDQTGGSLGAHRPCDPPPAAGGMPSCILGPDRGPALPPVRELTAGDDVTCATIRDGDAVICWGARGRSGGSTTPVLDPPTPVKLPDGATLSAARMIAQGGAMCAIDHDAAMWCWGDGFGELPERQPEAGVIDVSIGPLHGCTIDAEGLRCWGDNRNGQAGDFAAAKACSTRAPCTLDAPYPIDLDATRVVAGTRHTCVLGRDGKVTCFGSNEVGQLGRDDAFLVGDRGSVLAGGFVLDGVTELAGEGTRTCALRGGRELWCWGASIGHL